MYNNHIYCSRGVTMFGIFDWVITAIIAALLLWIIIRLIFNIVVSFVKLVSFIIGLVVVVYILSILI
ncbi:MAG: hypothetical protein PWP15_179 [Methanothermococcus sp.]|jgi:hypothetical protein|nr:hypothetical protein [Methanothermococcus sp.]MDK2987476.1 hypothetical protein [Methanothermococcus sp.]